MEKEGQVVSMERDFVSYVWIDKPEFWITNICKRYFTSQIV